jgi:hypothetical protein
MRVAFRLVLSERSRGDDREGDESVSARGAPV